MRIVSLLPSATEMICRLGLQDYLVAVSHECDFPPGVERLPKVTEPLIPVGAASADIDQTVRERVSEGLALYALDHDAIGQVSPDVIVTQTLCNVCAVAESEVEKAICQLPSSPKVVNLEPKRLDGVLDAISNLSQVLGVPSKGVEVVGDLRKRIGAVRTRSQLIGTRPRIVFLEWIDPPFVAGHWTPQLIELAGGNCLIGTSGERSFVTSWESVVALDPDVMFFSCCGFTVERTMVDVEKIRLKEEWKTLKCVKSRRVFVIDGSAYFNRPGPRLVDSLEILANAIEPTIHPLPENLPSATPVA